MATIVVDVTGPQRCHHLYNMFHFVMNMRVRSRVERFLSLIWLINDVFLQLLVRGRFYHPGYYHVLCILKTWKRRTWSLCSLYKKGSWSTNHITTKSNRHSRQPSDITCFVFCGTRLTVGIGKFLITPSWPVNNWKVALLKKKINQCDLLGGLIVVLLMFFTQISWFFSTELTKTAKG